MKLGATFIVKLKIDIGRHIQERGMKQERAAFYFEKDFI